MSDHGYNMRKHTGKQNPILYIKGINEHHSSMKVSDKAISHVDLQDAYFDLLAGKSSRELFKDIGSERERRFILYRHTKEKYMYEYKLVIEDKSEFTEEFLKKAPISVNGGFGSLFLCLLHAVDGFQNDLDFLFPCIIESFILFALCRFEKSFILSLGKFLFTLTEYLSLHF